MNAKVILAAVCGVGLVVTTMGKTCTWLGGSGNWNDPEKWAGGEAGIPSGTSDQVILTAGDAPAAITNNLGEFTVKYISFTGTGKVTLCGDKLNIAQLGGNYRPDLFLAACPVEVNVPIKMSCNGSEGYVNNTADVVFNCDFELNYTGNCLRLRTDTGKSTTFNGSFTDVNPNGSTQIYPPV